MSPVEQAVERAKLLVANKVVEFRLIHRNTFGPEPQWGAAFLLNFGDEPRYCLGRSLEDAVNKAVDLYHVENAIEKVSG